MFCIPFSTLLFQFDNMKIWKYVHENRATSMAKRSNETQEKPSTWKYIVVVTRLRRLFEHSLDEKMTVIGLFSRNILFILLVIRFVIIFDIVSCFPFGECNVKCRKKLTTAALHLQKSRRFSSLHRIISQKSWQFLWINRWKLYYIFVVCVVHRWIIL